MAGLSKKEKDSLVVGIIPLVERIASALSRDLSGALTADDLTSVGMAGAMSAAESYEPSLGYSFATYARPRIRGAMIDHVRSERDIEGVSRGVRDASIKIAKAKKALSTVLGRDPRREEMARELGVTPAAFDRMLTRSEVFQTLSLDAPLSNEEGEEGGNLEGSISSAALTPLEIMEQGENNRQLMQALNVLSPDQRRVLQLVRAGYRAGEIAEELNVSTTTVASLKQSAISTLQAAQSALVRAGERPRGQEPVFLPPPPTPRGLLENPRGRRVPNGRLIHVGSLGERIHMSNPETGRALCAPHNFDVRPADGDQVTCYRCQKLMAVNRALRGSDIAVGTAKAIVSAAAARRTK